MKYIICTAHSYCGGIHGCCIVSANTEREIFSYSREDISITINIYMHFSYNYSAFKSTLFREPLPPSFSPETDGGVSSGVLSRNVFSSVSSVTEVVGAALCRMGWLELVSLPTRLSSISTGCMVGLFPTDENDRSALFGTVCALCANAWGENYILVIKGQIS